MSKPVISVESLSKLYRLGEITTGTLSHDLNRWWHKVRGKEDPYLKIGQVNDRARKENASSPESSSDYVYALEDINFTVNQGEVLGIIGRNGAGKSTLLKILSRVTAPTSGRIKVKGRIASLLEVGTGFHPELSGRENIYLNGAILGMRRHEITSKLDEIVDFSGCSAYLDTPVKRYSSGMYVRLAFAVAAHLEPEILIVDEVLAVGDAEFQKRCLAKMDEVSHSQGRTILFVSHQLGVVSALCQKGLLISEGKIIAYGGIQTVIDDYLAENVKSSGELNWAEHEAPKGEHIRLDSIRILSGQSCTIAPAISQPLRLEVDYTILRSGPIINLSFHLLDAMGSCILATGNIPSSCKCVDALSSTVLSTGQYRSICTLPSDFLNDNTYRVSVFGVCNYATIDVQAKECLVFKGHDDGQMRREFTGKWIGQIRPRLAWNTSALN